MNGHKVDLRLHLWEILVDWGRHVRADEEVALIGMPEILAQVHDLASDHI